GDTVVGKTPEAAPCGGRWQPPPPGSRRRGTWLTHIGTRSGNFSAEHDEACFADFKEKKRKLGPLYGWVASPEAKFKMERPQVNVPSFPFSLHPRHSL
ncbi:hypothetical protein P7K49_002694, partial [Saguinus oedipus]